MRDGKQIIASLYNDRALLPDDETPGPHETCYHGRIRRIHPLFGQGPCAAITTTTARAAPADSR